VNSEQHNFIINVINDAPLYSGGFDLFFRLSHVQEQLAEQIEIPAPEQVLIFKGSMFDDLVEPTTPVSSYPLTTKSSPIVIFTSADNWILSKTHIRKLKNLL